MPIAPEPIDQQRFRDGRRHHRLEIGPDQLAIGLDAGQDARTRAGGNDDVPGAIGALPEHAVRRRMGGCTAGFDGCDRHLAGLLELRLAPDHRHLVLLEQAADPAIEPAGHRRASA